MARYDLDLRMGIDSKLQSAELDTGALSYAIDTQNLYVDALKSNRETTERQLINADKAYSIRDKSERVILTNGIGRYNLVNGENSFANGDSYSYSIGQGVVNNCSNSFNIGKYNLYTPTLESVPMIVWTTRLFRINKNIAIVYAGTSHRIDKDKGIIVLENEEKIEYDYDTGFPNLTNKSFSFSPEDERKVVHNNITEISGNTFGVSSDGMHAGIYYELTCDSFEIKQNESYLFVIGNGISKDNRSNAFTVDYDGNAYMQNNLKVCGSIEVPEIHYENTVINLNASDVNNHLVISPGLIVQGDFQSENALISGNLTISELNVADDALFDKNVTIKGSSYFNNAFIFNSVTNGYEKVASETYVTNKIGEAKEEIMEDVREIADSIITDVWYRSSTPPTTVKQAKLLWIRYDDTSTYGNGVLYYFNPNLLNENLTDAQVKLESNWIPMSAIYS